MLLRSKRVVGETRYSVGYVGHGGMLATIKFQAATEVLRVSVLIPDLFSECRERKELLEKVCEYTKAHVEEMLFKKLDDFGLLSSSAFRTAETIDFVVVQVVRIEGYPSSQIYVMDWE